MNEETQSPYPRQQPPVMTDGKFPGDLIVGIFVLVIYGCCTVFGAMQLMGARGAASAEQAAPIEAILSTLATVSILIAGIGITLSRKWGHILALIGSILHTVLLAIALQTVPEVVAEQARLEPERITPEMQRMSVTMGYAMLSIMIVLQIILGIYCALRLSRKVGPPPFN